VPAVGGCARSQESRVTTAERERVESLLQEGLAVQTTKEHLKAFCLWEEFLAGRRDSKEGEDPFLTLIENPDDKVTLWVVFLDHLYSSKGLRSEKIKNVESKLKSYWVSKRRDVSFLDNFSSTARDRVYKALGRSQDEMAAHLTKRGQLQKWPVVKEMVPILWRPWDMFEGKAIPTTHTMDELGASLVALLQYNFGSRVGNLVQTSGKETSNLRVKELQATTMRLKDLSFTVGGRCGGAAGRRNHECTETVIVGGAIRGVDGDRAILAVKFNYFKTKTGAPVLDLSISRETKNGERLLKCVVEWVRMSGGSDDQPLMIRVATLANGKTITRHTRSEDVTTIIRKAATNIGLDPKRFSSKSMRIGLASSDCIKDEDKDDLGGWKRGGGTRIKVYDQRRKQGRLEADEVGERDSVNLESLKKRMRT